MENANPSSEDLAAAFAHGAALRSVDAAGLYEADEPWPSMWLEMFERLIRNVHGEQLLVAARAGMDWIDRQPMTVTVLETLEAAAKFAGISASVSDMLRAAKEENLEPVGRLHRQIPFKVGKAARCLMRRASEPPTTRC
jgi:hypothetical protein